MTMDLIQQRLQNQKLFSPCDTPEELVSWFGAMQSQDFAAAKWALALRSTHQTDASIEKAYNDGKILRTHIMRPTWHFVTPSDIRWLLALTSTRVHRFNGYYYRQSGLNKEIFTKSNEVIKSALVGGNQLTREELNRYLKEANIPTENLGLSFTLMQAELDGIIVSGPRRGKQFTYMLLDERVPQTKPLSSDEALFELTKRYFQSHGPAQAADFSWWSGLSLTEARRGTDMNKPQLQSEEIGGKAYWYLPTKVNKHTQDVFLIPGFDEYFIAYKDRSDILDPQYAKKLNQGGGMVSGAILINGKMLGGWKRVITGKKVVMKFRLFEKITEAQKETLKQKIKHYGTFLNLPVEIQN